MAAGLRSGPPERLTKDLDEQVQAWAERKLEEDYPFVLFDAMHVKVRRQGGVRSTAILIAVGITKDGQREILGFHPALQVRYKKVAVPGRSL